MVQMCRVDERLLHGQVAVTWISDLNPNSILIANDEIMDNEIAKLAIRMVKPEGISLAIRSVEGAAAILNDPRAAVLKIFVLVKTLEDAVRLVKLSPGIRQVNVGGIKKKAGSRLIAPAVYLSPEDQTPLKELCSLTETVEFRNIPSDLPRDGRELIW